MQTDKKYVEPGKELPVSYEVDVLVCGGGPSGIAAAVSAAKNGAEVMLIERFNCLGGQGTIGLYVHVGVYGRQTGHQGRMGRVYRSFRGNGRLHQAFGYGGEKTVFCS